jgi:hypothetical protein
MHISDEAIDCVANIPTKWNADGTVQDYLLDRHDAELVVEALHQNDLAIVDVEVLKVVICDCLIAINDDLDPVNRDKWGPIIPPTAIDWIGDALVRALAGSFTSANPKVSDG